MKTVYAFPSLYVNPGTLTSDIPQGMTLRDWFAGMVLQGMMAANATCPPNVNENNVDAILARESYSVADAMLEERNKTP